MSIGRESSDEWASRNVDAMWGYNVNSGPKDPHKVTETTRLWYRKFLRLEGFTPESLGADSTSTIDKERPKFSTSKRKRITADNEEPAKRQKEQSTRTVAQPMRALGSMTNVPHESTTNRRQGHGDKGTVTSSTPVVPAVLSNDQCDFPKGKADKSASNIKATRYVPITPMSTDTKYTSHKEVVTCTPFSSNEPSNNSNRQTPATTNSSMQRDSLKRPRSLQCLDPVITTSSTFFGEDDSLGTIENNLPTQIPESPWPQRYADTAIARFIRDSYVWIHRDANNIRPADRPPASHLVPQHRRIGVIYFLLIICGCRVEVGKNVYCRKTEQFTHANKCVMFVKTEGKPEVQEGLNWLLRTLESWRAELNKPGNKELFVFDSQMITYTSLLTFRGDVASKALWRSSRSSWQKEN